MENQSYITKDIDDGDNKKRWLPIVVAVILLLFLISALGVAVIMVGQRTNLGSKAYTTTSTENPETLPTSSVVVDNSYAFASPLNAKAGGEKVRITVIVLDGRGFGVENKEVAIGINESINITPIQNITDEFGKAIFDISVDKAGVYVIIPSINNAPLKQTLTVVFD